MLKYTTTEVTFREIPDEVCLCINISGCPIHCPGCHSKELWEDIGEELTQEALYKLINNNSGITCVCFMGGDNDYRYTIALSLLVKSKYPDLHTAWYSGRDNIPKDWCALGAFDYIKIGSYIEEFGPLDNPKTNQILFKIRSHSLIIDDWEDITYKFWRNEETSDSTR